jgi:hypothetical protein
MLRHPSLDFCSCRYQMEAQQLRMDVDRLEKAVAEKDAENALVKKALAAAVAEKDAAIRVAEQAVLAAIKALGSKWSVQRKSCMLSTLIDRLSDAKGSFVACHAQVHWDDDGPGGHQGGAGARALVHRGEWHRHTQRTYCGSCARADPDRLGQDRGLADADATARCWSVLNADPATRRLRELILRFHMSVVLL